MNELTRAYLHDHLPELRGDLLRQDIVEHGTLHALPAGQIILEEMQHIDYVPLIGRGGVKVIRHREAEQHIFLYFIRPGETCTMTLSACLRRQTSQVHAQTVVATEVILLPAERVYYYTKHYPGWNEFTLESFRRKFDDILHAYDRLAFAPLEDRLLDYLRELAAISGQDTLVLTHAELAGELAASRVSVSRVLKQLERAGRLRLGRSSICLLGPYPRA